MAVDVTSFSAQARMEFELGMETAYARSVPARVESFTTVYPSTTKVETHTYMSNIPRLARFKGYSPAVRLEDNQYTVTNFPYRVGPVSISMDDLNDNQTGGYLRQINNLPSRAQKDIQLLITDKLAAGTTDLCFDGTAFFANSHTWGSGDNLMAGSGDSMDNAGNDGVTHYIIALIVNNSDIKPVVFQEREKLSSLLSDENDAEALKKREFEYWADARFGLAYGMWWDAIHATVTDTPTVPECYTMLEAIINRFRTFTLPKGRNADSAIYVHEGWEPESSNLVLLTSMRLGTIMKRAIKITQFQASGGNVDNVYQNAATIIPTSSLGA